jgi:hypothetical protein
MKSITCNKFSSFFIACLILGKMRPSKKIVISMAKNIVIKNRQILHLMYILAQLEEKKNKINSLWSVLRKMCTWQEFLRFLIINGFLNIISSIVFALIHFLIFKENKKRLKQMILIQDVLLFSFLIRKPLKIVMIYYKLYI